MDLFFPSRDALYAALRLCDDPESWRLPAERLRLGDDEPAWLLRIDGVVPGLSPAQAEVGGDLVVVGEESWPITERAAFGTLLQAVPLAPGRGESDVTWLRLDSPDRFREAAQACLMLGNDRLRYLPLGEGRVLLRVERLSAFLAEKWAPTPGFAAWSPAPADPRLLVPQGWVYPLADKVHFASTDESVLWLIEADGAWQQLAGTPADIYERIEIDPRQLRVETVAAADDVPTVRVELRLEPGETAERPQLWWLEPDQEGVLDRLLREASEAELNNLQLATLARADGRAAHLLVERLGGLSTLAPPVQGGRAFYPRLPIEHLFLPTGQRLAPVLSRRSLIEALGLAEDHLTLIEPAEAGLRVTQVPAAALRPLPDIVDYFVARAEPAVTGLLEQVRLDLELEAEPADEPTEAAPAEPRGLWAAVRAWLGR